MQHLAEGIQMKADICTDVGNHVEITTLDLKSFLGFV